MPFHHIRRLLRRPRRETLRLLFVNFGQADNNSAQHINGFARALAALGHTVTVASVKSVPDGEFQPLDGFHLASHRTVPGEKTGAFPGSAAAPDLIHVWTPREIIRDLANRALARWPRARLIIHLEDNEDTLFHRHTGLTVADARALDDAALVPHLSRGLIDPRHAPDFLRSASGLTLVYRSLAALVPAGQPSCEIVPLIDPAFFAPAPPDPSLRHALGIPAGATVIGYNGNDHHGNTEDIRQLYATVQILLDRGHSVRLLRTGHTLPEILDAFPASVRAAVISCGFLPRETLPAHMRQAGFFLQPGGPDEFNTHRLPAKVPEYLMLARPVIMGTANLAAELTHQENALILPEMTARNAADAAEWLMADPARATALGTAARHFALARFAPDAVIPPLLAFYRQRLG